MVPNANKILPPILHPKFSQGTAGSIGILSIGIMHHPKLPLFRVLSPVWGISTCMLSRVPLKDSWYMGMDQNPTAMARGSYTWDPTIVTLTIPSYWLWLPASFCMPTGNLPSIAAPQLESWTNKHYPHRWNMGPLQLCLCKLCTLVEQNLYRMAYRMSSDVYPTPHPCGDLSSIWIRRVLSSWAESAAICQSPKDFKLWTRSPWTSPPCCW